MHRIGIYGGTFDPIHVGHLNLCAAMKERLELDEILIIPTGTSPHKAMSATKAQHRLKMCELAVKDYGLHARVSDMEIRREGKSYTFLTVTELLEKESDCELYLIMGADMFMSLESWYRFDDLKNLVVFAAVQRDDVSTADLESEAGRLRDIGCRCVVVSLPEVEVSSTAIRNAVSAGESIEGLVTESVQSFIEDKGLYKSCLCPEKREHYKKILRMRLSDKRYRHCLAVAEEAVRLARKYGADPVAAEEAGLLHDITKETDEETHKFIIAQRETMTELEEKTHKLWHAMSGAAYVEKQLKITDEDVINAIRYHTTGRAGMSLLEKVIFIADFTSADRDYRDVDIMRKKADESLEEALRYSLGYTIRDIEKHGGTVHPDTVDAYEEYRIKN